MMAEPAPILMEALSVNVRVDTADKMASVLTLMNVRKPWTCVAKELTAKIQKALMSADVRKKTNSMIQRLVNVSEPNVLPTLAHLMANVFLMVST